VNWLSSSKRDFVNIQWIVQISRFILIRYQKDRVDTEIILVYIYELKPKQTRENKGKKFLNKTF
jgi:hypothetical protein